MTPLLPQFAGLALLVAGAWQCYRRWVRPHARLGIPACGLLGLTIAAFMGGGIGGPVWWADAPWAFAWDLPPLAGRMLAAAGWTFVVIGFLALERPTGRRLRVVALLLAVYLAPLAAAILLFHLDRFDLAAPITYAFFVIAVGMTVAALWYLLQPPEGFADAAPAPPNPLVRSWLGLVAIVIGLWGLALFITDRGPIAQLWVWPGDLLTSRLIAVMLLALASGAAFSLRDANTTQLMLAGALTYGLGVVTANLWGLGAGQPIQTPYLVAFGLIALGSAILLIYERRTGLAARTDIAKTHERNDP
jgi:hypothetical protein